MSKRIKEIIVRYDDKQGFIYGNTLGEVVGELVRCKECKFSEVWESTAGNELYCEKQRVCPYDWGTLTEFYVKPDDFCSYGERESE